jgi:hypothetical protein
MMGDNGDGDANPVGEVGESTAGDCTAEASAESIVKRVGLSESLFANELFRDFAPIRLFFSLNFSNQLWVRTFSLPSGLPQVLAKNRAFSLIISSLSG